MLSVADATDVATDGAAAKAPVADSQVEVDSEAVAASEEEAASEAAAECSR